MTTPREQLIEAIARKRCELGGGNPNMLTRSALLNEYGGHEWTLEALSDLGCVVLMPVKEGQSVANVIVLDQKHVLRTTQEERNEGVYINALESEQS